MKSGEAARVPNPVAAAGFINQMAASEGSARARVY